MKISDLLSMCFHSLFRRKVRTLLTVIGVVIGTCSIVIMVSLGVGLNKSQEEQMAQWMDLTQIQVYYNNFGGQNDSSNQMALNDEAIEYIRSLGHVDGVSPVLELYQEGTVVSGRFQFSGGLVGMDLAQMEKMGYLITEGRGVTDTDDKYTVLFGEKTGYSFYEPRTGKWYGEYDEMGNPKDPPVDPFRNRFTLKVNTDQEGGGGQIFYGGGMAIATSSSVSGGGQTNSSNEPKKEGRTNNLKVAGILKADQAKDYNTYGGIYIDISLARQLQEEYNKLNGIKTKFTGYNSAKIKVDSFENVAEVEAKIKELGFETYSAEQDLEMAKKQSRTIQLVLGCLGGISLLVAALGITNTMIMSIYERTREIGVMKVLGCELKNIRTMFLCEAGAIGFMGGAIGLIFSYLISYLVNYFVGGMMSEYGPMQISIIPFWLALLGMGFSVAVGLIAGFMPANRAVKISPLSAIRQD